MENPDNTSIINETAVEFIHDQMEFAAAQLGKEANRRNSQRYYEHAYHDLPPGLRDMIRTLTVVAYPNLVGGSIKNPFAMALEQGFVVGTRIAKNILNNNEYTRYLKRMEANFGFLQQHYSNGIYDLEDIASFGGSKTLALIGPHIRPDLMVYSTKNTSVDLRYNSMYANAIGYGAAQAETMLCEAAIRCQQAPDIIARQDIQRDVNVLGNVALTILPQHFAQKDTI